MELLREAIFWMAVVQWIVLAVSVYSMWRSRKIQKAVDATRPLLSDTDWAAMRPGDTALVMLKMDQMTEDQQQRMMKGIIQIMQRARERGIEVIALPVRKGDQAVVVTRSIEQGNNGGQSDDDGTSQRDPAGGQVAAHP